MHKIQQNETLKTIQSIQTEQEMKTKDERKKQSIRKDEARRNAETKQTSQKLKQYTVFHIVNIVLVFHKVNHNSLKILN